MGIARELPEQAESLSVKMVLEVEQMLENLDVDWYAMARKLEDNKFVDAVASEAKEKK